MFYLRLWFTFWNDCLLHDVFFRNRALCSHICSGYGLTASCWKICPLHQFKIHLNEPTWGDSYFFLLLSVSPTSLLYKQTQQKYAPSMHKYNVKYYSLCDMILCKNARDTLTHSPFLFLLHETKQMIFGAPWRSSYRISCPLCLISNPAWTHTSGHLHICTFAESKPVIVLYFFLSPFFFFRRAKAAEKIYNELTGEHVRE